MYHQQLEFFGLADDWVDLDDEEEKSKPETLREQKENI